MHLITLFRVMNVTSKVILNIDTDDTDIEMVCDD